VISIHPVPRTGIQVMLNDSWGGDDKEKLRNYALDAQRLVRAGLFSRIGHYPNQEWGPFQLEDFEFIDSVSRSYS
jgi:hypothetical protein